MRNMEEITCGACNDTGWVVARTGSEDDAEDRVPCPDCDAGLAIIEKGTDRLDFSGSGER